MRFFRGVEANETNEKVTNEFQSIQSLMSIDGSTKVTIKDFCKKQFRVVNMILMTV